MNMSRKQVESTIFGDQLLTLKERIEKLLDNEDAVVDKRGFEFIKEQDGQFIYRLRKANNVIHLKCLPGEKSVKVYIYKNRKRFDTKIIESNT